MEMTKESIKLGLMPPLSGVVGIYGQEIARAGQIACDEVNENGGVLGRPLELVIEDDGSLPESSVTAAEKLINQHHCSAIIGNLLSNSRIAVAYRVAEPRKIPYLNFSFYEGSISSRYFFHFAALPNQQIEQMIPYMCKKYGSRLFFAGNNYEWPRGSIDAAKRALIQIDGEIVGEEYCPIGVDDAAIEDLLDQVAKADPDVFVPYFAGDDQVKLLTRFTERGLKKQMKVVMGHYDEMMASQLSAEVREGFYSSNSYFMTVDTDENREALARLAKQPDVSGIWPQGNGIMTNFGEGTYACVKAFAKAANEAGNLEPEALVESLKTISVLAPQGKMQMNPAHHHAQVNSYLSRCRADGTFEIVEKFGELAAVLPERYTHQRISRQATMEDDIRLQARILEQMGEAVLLVSSQDDSIIYTNSGAERMFGYAEGEMLSQDIECLDVVEATKSAQSSGAIISILKHKGEWKGEISATRKDTLPVFCSVSISSFTHPSYGEVWLWVASNITERKRIENELQQYQEQLEEMVEQRTAQLQKSEARLTQLLSSSPVVIYTCEAGGDYAATYISENVKELFGYQTEQFLDDPKFWASGIHPDDAPRVFSGLGKLFEDGVHTHEYRFKLANGEYIWVHDELKLVKDEQGIPVKIIGYWADVSARKESEETIQAKTKQVQTVISSAPLVLWSCDKNGVFTFSDGSALKDMGLKPGQVVGQSVFEIYVDYPEIIDANRRVLSGETISHESQVGEYCFESHYTPNFSEDGGVESYIGVAIDITERKKSEAQVEAARKEAESANAAKSEFLSSMSHELRTPLNAIIGYGQLIEMGSQDEKEKKNVKEILKGGNHLLELIDEILDLSRIDAGKVELSMEECDLNSILDMCLTFIKPMAVKRNINVVNNIGSEADYRLHVDYMRVKQVILNLMSNAVKYNKDNGTVTLSAEVVDEEYLRINVSDTGNGLTEQQLQSLFKPFERLKNHSGIEGTGIGLVISKRLVEIMGGIIGVESQVGKGSTFWLQLELEKTDTRSSLLTEGQTTENEIASIEKKSGDVKSILYIEDNPINICLMEDIVESSTSHTLITVTDAVQGLVLAEERQPDLILMDITMPVMDGYEALAELQANQATRHIPVIAVSANAMQQDINKGKAAGFQNYITKPFNIKNMIDIIEDALS